jgi:hypothetical protein
MITPRLPLPFAFALGANLVAAALPLTLLDAPNGSAIRPMSDASIICYWALFAAVWLLPPSLLMAVDPKRRRWGTASLILSVTPIFVSSVSMDLIALAKGLTVKE